MKNRNLWNFDSQSGYKRIAFVLFSLFFGISAQAQQIPQPIWSYTFSQEEVSVGDEVDLIFKTNIATGFYIYSNDFDPNLGPQLTETEFVEHPSYALIGKLRPIAPSKKFDDVWGGDISYFKKHAEFRQKIRILAKNPVIKGILYFQTCSEQSCVSFDPGFTFSGIKVNPAAKIIPAQIPKTEENPAEVQKIDIQESIPRETKADSLLTPVNTKTEGIEKTAGDTSKGVAGFVENKENSVLEKGLMALFLLGLALGFGAVLTPCVFPMLPMTVAFFTKHQEKGAGRKMALFYGFSIILIYTTIGLVVSSVLGATFAYSISTHWLPNLLFFLIFIVFGISFLGAFELVLPNSFVNKIDKNSDRGGYVGVFFIALTLVVISFSCTVPIVGSLAILAENGEIMRPLAGMLGFSISFALPFTLFAFFPQWLSKLPKSGGWLNSVKVFFGFLEIALALKFFSQADLAYRWGILDRDVFLSIWIVLAVLMGFYFLGKLKFSHDSDLKFVSVSRFFIAVCSFSFAVYLLPGLVGAPLKPLAGILPPLTTQDFALSENSGTAGDVLENTRQDTVLYSDILHIPLGLPGYFDYDQGLAAAKQSGKPAFLDFTGHSCANCRKMEEDVWPNPEVASRLRDKVVIVSLYTDEKMVLPKEKWYTSERDGRVKKTLGNQNSDREISQYGANAQPMYFIVDEEGAILSTFNGYKNDPVAFANFIDRGVAAYNAGKN